MKDDMKLPPGKKCKDCKYMLHCEVLFSAHTENTTCDFSPSRFKDTNMTKPNKNRYDAMEKALKIISVWSQFAILDRDVKTNALKEFKQTTAMCVEGLYGKL